MNDKNPDGRDEWAEFEHKPADKPLVVQSTAVANPLDVDPEAFSNALTRRKQNREALMTWIREALVDGTDFGKIHIVSKDKCQAGRRCTNQYHFSKPSLFKSGAEKIAGMLGLTPTFPNMREYERMALDGKRIETIILRCEILDGHSNVVGVGMGARSVSQDYGDLNKAIKMCQKSAQIDATLRTGGLSEIFTQDVEDMGLDKAEKKEETPAPVGPDGYANWKADMAAKADEGKDALKDAWQDSAAALRNHAAKHDAAWWAQTKTKALRHDPAG